MKKQSLVLSVETFDFTNDSGERINGAKMSVLSDRLTGDNQKGYRVAKLSVNEDVAKKIKTVPSLCDITYSFNVNGQGKVDLKPIDVDYIQDAQIFAESKKVNA